MSGSIPCLLFFYGRRRGGSGDADTAKKGENEGKPYGGMYGQMDRKKGAVSPINGQAPPEGKPFRTGDERARAAGKKSGEKRRERKTRREDRLAVLTDMEIPEKTTGKKIPVQEALSTALIKAALSGNVRAFEIIRDTVGEKPVENVVASLQNGGDFVLHITGETNVEDD